MKRINIPQQIGVFYKNALYPKDKKRRPYSVEIGYVWFQTNIHRHRAWINLRNSKSELMPKIIFYELTKETNNV